MKGFLFYQEFKTPDKREPTGNCVAVTPVLIGPDGCLEAIGAIFFVPNSHCCSIAVHPGYLRKYTRRISAAKAREIHPALFDRLE